MSYFNTCRICGANLDPGEKCDCEEEKKIRKIKFDRKKKIYEQKKSA